MKNVGIIVFITDVLLKYKKANKSNWDRFNIF